MKEQLKDNAADVTRILMSGQWLLVRRGTLRVSDSGKEGEQYATWSEHHTSPPDVAPRVYGRLSEVQAFQVGE